MPPHDRSPSPTRRVIDAAHDLVAAIWPDYRGDVAEALIALAEVESEARRNGAPTGWLAFARPNARRKLDGSQPDTAPKAQPRTAEDERRSDLDSQTREHAAEVARLAAWYRARAVEASRRKCSHREDGDDSACDHCSLKG